MMGHCLARGHLKLCCYAICWCTPSSSDACILQLTRTYVRTIPQMHYAVLPSNVGPLSPQRGRESHHLSGAALAFALQRVDALAHPVIRSSEGPHGGSRRDFPWRAVNLPQRRELRV